MKLRAAVSPTVALLLAAASLALPVSLSAQVLNSPPPRPRPSAWPELPQGDLCPTDTASLPGRDNFLSIRKFSSVSPLEGCSPRWNDGLHRQFFRGSPPSRRGIECLGSAFGVTHMIDLRRPDEIRMDSRSDGFRSEQEALAD
jgi:hypothetical protein